MNAFKILQVMISKKIDNEHLGYKLLAIVYLEKTIQGYFHIEEDLYIVN